jgi:polyisoprenoid-binding protein YceI
LTRGHRHGAKQRVAAAFLATTAGAVFAWASATDAAEESPAGTITFEGKNLFATAKGRFHRWRIAHAEVDRSQPEKGVVVVEVDIESIDTGIGRRDRHLRSDDFFDVASYPTATVRVHSVQPDGQSERGNARYTAKFDVRIKEIEQSLDGTFEVTSLDPPMVEGELTIDRTEFGVGGPYRRWNPLSVNREVPIRFSATIRTPR